MLFSMKIPPVLLFLPTLLLVNLTAAVAKTESKVLVAVIAESRSQNLTFHNFKTYVLDVLNADLALAIGVKAGHHVLNHNPLVEHAKYKFVFQEPPGHFDYAALFDYAYQFTRTQQHHLNNKSEVMSEDLYKYTRDVHLLGTKQRANAPKSIGTLMFYRWWLLVNLLGYDLLDKYDYYIITRSDYMFVIPHFNPSLYDPRIYVPNDMHWLGIVDRYAVVPRKYIESYLNVLSTIFINKNNTYFQFLNSSWYNTELLVKFHLKQENLLSQVYEFPYVMYTVRAKSDRFSWEAGRGGYNEKLGYVVKYGGEFQRSMLYKETFEKCNCTVEQFYRSRMTPFK